MADDKPNKYDAVKDLIGLGKAETKSLYYLRYGQDPEKMDYDNIGDDFIMHNEFRPAPVELVAEETSLPDEEVNKALDNCLQRGLVCRKKMDSEEKDGYSLQDGYYLNEKQNKTLKRAEYMAMEATQMRLWGSKQRGHYL